MSVPVRDKAKRECNKRRACSLVVIGSWFAEDKELNWEPLTEEDSTLLDQVSPYLRRPNPVDFWTWPRSSTPPDDAILY